MTLVMMTTIDDDIVDDDDDLLFFDVLFSLWLLKNLILMIMLPIIT